MTEPRFAVCTVGDDGFSVEDRKTSERLGYYRRRAEAEKARDAFNRLYQEEEVTEGDGSKTDPASALPRYRTHGQSHRKQA
jgi:hypothetical protein